MASVELNDEEQEGLIAIIDGTMDSMDDVEWDDPLITCWIDILLKLGEPGIECANSWKQIREEARQMGKL